MNKRKIMILALSICMIAILAVGGTLAYFMDTDTQVNVFTFGNVDIDLWENFGDNDGEPVELIPAVGTQSEDNPYVTEYTNTVTKEAYVTNEGTETAYVRLHIALPQVLTNENASRIINVICDDQSTVEGKWSWSKVAEGANYNGLAADSWNRYSTEIDGVPYSVFVVTYETVLGVGESTVDAISKAYMHPATTQEELAAADTLYGEVDWKKIYIVAEGAQAAGMADAGFTTAHAVLDEAFGVPTADDYVEPNFKAASEQDTWAPNTIESEF